jgi:c-di-GMP-binding flagellar brake protein YcgR
MRELGKIEGKRIFELFEYLLKKRVIVSIQIAGADYERLTCAIALKEDATGKWLLVDRPDGFQAAAAEKDPLILKFSFNGPDQLEYVFVTSEARIAGRELKIPFPPCVERVQRRKDFRMEAPPGARMHVALNDGIKAVLGLINISIDGALGALIKHNFKGLKGSLLAENQFIVGGSIIVPGHGVPPQPIMMKQSEIRRIEHQKEKNIYRYAVQFIEMDPAEKRKLTQTVYHLQRQFLKRHSR